MLATQPAMGWTSKLKHHALGNVRVFRIGGFEKTLVFYRATKKRVEIIRVLQGMQDLSLLLGKNDPG